MEKTIKDIETDPDDYGLELTETHRKVLKAEIENSNDMETLKQNIINIIDDIYDDIDNKEESK